MGEFCEFEIDFEQFDDIRAVVVHDECGAHEDVWFYRLDGLKAENAKLRELASLMWCELHAEQGSAQRRMEIADRMPELFGEGNHDRV